MNTRITKIHNPALIISPSNLLQDNFTYNPSPITHHAIKKPIRSSSGVVVVTTFTKPYPCPGKCIFCPNIPNVPKSYIPSEPACARANTLKYNPYTQISKRIEVLALNGHNTDKIEIIVSGGTFSSYPKKYLLYFFARTFEALNQVNPKLNLYKHSSKFIAQYLVQQQRNNEQAKHKSVGISIETRPDFVTAKLARFWRELGITKIQIGVQSMYNDILNINGRAHTVEQSVEAIQLLRQFGFKIQVHYMLNLYQSTPQRDIDGFKLLIDQIAPDELKIYPTSIVDNTILNNLYQKGKYTPYTTSELIDTITQIKQLVPPYCRINRVFRDIPSTEIVAGNDKTNLREMIWHSMKTQGIKCNCIRCREIRNESAVSKIKYEIIQYKVYNSKEYFIQAVSDTNTRNNCILGFLRLSIVKKKKQKEEKSVNIINEDCEIPDFLINRAMIREVHVYGTSEKIGDSGIVQHTGIGKKLIEIAINISQAEDLKKIYVISAVGTREYYKKIGFKRGKMGYMKFKLKGISER